MNHIFEQILAILKDRQSFIHIVCDNTFHCVWMDVRFFMLSEVLIMNDESTFLMKLLVYDKPLCPNDISVLVTMYHFMFWCDNV